MVTLALPTCTVEDPTTAIRALLGRDSVQRPDRNTGLIIVLLIAATAVLVAARAAASAFVPMTRPILNFLRALVLVLALLLLFCVALLADPHGPQPAPAPSPSPGDHVQSADGRHPMREVTGR